MKNSLLLLLWLITCSHAALGQQSQKALVEDFKKAMNDSLFISSHSLAPYEVFEQEKRLFSKGFEDPVDSLIFYAEPRQILGPFYSDTLVIFLKTIQVDSLYTMRVGNIYLNQDEEKAKKVLTAAQNGGDFNELCRQNTADNNSRPDCDLGWFYEGSMVADFEEEIRKYRKGDVFLTKTEYGYHVVKILEDPKRDRSRVRYVLLVLQQ